MCPPDYFGVFYEINPWMHRENRPDFELAIEQWHNLVANLRRAGAKVEVIEPVKGDVGSRSRSSISITGVLRSTIRMKQQASWWLPTQQRHAQGRLNERFVLGRRHRPPDHAP